MTSPTVLAPRPLGARCCDPDLRPLISTADAERATADLETLAHPIRLQLLEMLMRKEGDVCVCDLEAALPVKQPTVSHHLRLLLSAGLVQKEKQGLYTYYRVDRPALLALRERIRYGLSRLG